MRVRLLAEEGYAVSNVVYQIVRSDEEIQAVLDRCEMAEMDDYASTIKQAIEWLTGFTDDAPDIEAPGEDEEDA